MSDMTTSAIAAPSARRASTTVRFRACALQHGRAADPHLGRSTRTVDLLNKVRREDYVPLFTASSRSPTWSILGDAELM
jgi:hypothetical protein